MDLREASTGIDPRTHWYYRAKRLPLDRFVAARLRQAGHPLHVVDVGAGSGIFSEGLIERFPGRIAGVVRVDLHYERDTIVVDPRLNGGLLEHTRQLPATIERAVILLMDVLEHVEDASLFLRETAGRCRGRNDVFITVPAFQFLWSGHDEFLGHHRRYSLGALRDLAAASGIRVTAAYYFFGFLFPAVAAVRLLRGRGRVESDLRPLNPLANALLAGVARVETGLCRCNRLAGVTAVVEGVVHE